MDIPSSHSEPNGRSAMPRISYIWSKELQTAADQLPSNIGRSSVVHDLVGAFDLLNHDGNVRHTISQSVNVSEEGDIVHNMDHREDQTENTQNALNSGTPAFLGAGARVVAPDPSLGSPEMLKRYHDHKYVEYLMDPLGHLQGDDEGDSDGQSDDSLDSGSSSSSGMRERPVKRRRKEHGLEYDCPPFPALPAYARLVAAATTTACRELVQDSADISIVWDGGRHHALRNRASGFCYVADIVLGVMYLAKYGKARSIADIPALGPEPMRTDLSSTSRPLSHETTIPGATDTGPASSATEKETTVESGGNNTTESMSPNVEDGLVSGQATAVSAATGVSARVDDETRSASLSKSAKTRRPRVMYLDLDIHEGDGVHQAFLSPSHFPPSPSALSSSSTRKAKKPPRPPQVLTLSIHHHALTFFPPHRPFSSLPDRNTPHPFTLSVPLHAYPSPLTYAAIWPSVEKVKEAFDPDYVVLQLGVDGLPGDRVGQYGAWAITGEGGVGWCLDQVSRWGLQVVVTGGGGYDHANAARAWAMATSILLDRRLEEDEAIPHHDHFPLYAPSFTLEISPSHATDENSVENVTEINGVFEHIAGRIKSILAAHA